LQGKTFVEPAQNMHGSVQRRMMAQHCVRRRDGDIRDDPALVRVTEI
jgi:hypothetical protein